MPTSKNYEQNNQLDADHKTKGFISGTLYDIQHSLWYEFLMMIMMQHITYMGIMWMIITTRNSGYICYPLLSLLMLLIGSGISRYHVLSMCLLFTGMLALFVFARAFPDNQLYPYYIRYTISPFYYYSYLMIILSNEYIKYVRRQ